ncbi:TonB-dependent siderophore receptor [Pseudoalteromonas sp. H105]|uniref:TonB-dependent siderophore receptor n=1 Tax=Pseudoalteromonas sp. H105 TaxID=1348393 RepID=UPI0007320E89|nr:TonB-dependent siderophore receptor [Pseudoalteromonas sp. H105]KTF15786.1 TonB-dependent receptor [Pseudoalteromonas sp. H105]
MSALPLLRLSKLAICTSFALGSIAHATSQNNNNDSDKSYEKIAVYGQHYKNYITEDAQSATKLGLTIKETPQSVSVISRALMDDFSLDDINAVLETTPGVTVEQIETDRTYFKARGFEITNFQINGMGTPQDNGSIQGTLDTAIFESVEVVRGANGLMTGAGNPSATVNMVLKKPTYQTQISASASYGSWDNKRIELDASTALAEDHAVRVAFTKQTTDSYLDRYKQDKTIYYFAYEGQLTSSTVLSVNYVDQQKDADSPLWGALPLYYSDGSATNFNTSTSTAADWSYWNNSTEQLFVSLEQSIANTWLLKASYAHLVNEQDSNLFYVYGTPNHETGLGLTGYASEYDHKDKHDILDLYAAGKFNVFGMEHDLSFGVNQADMDNIDKSLYDFTTGNGFPAMPELGGWDGIAPAPTLTDGLTGADVTNRQRSAYISTRIRTTNSLSLLAGVSHVNWQSKGESYGTAKDKDSDQTIPYFGTVYDINENVSAYASYTETFVPQTERDITGDYLDPITGESREIGIKAQLLDNDLFVTLAYFDAKQVGLAVAIAGSAPDDTRYYGADGISSDGFEVELSGKISDTLSTSFSYSTINIEGDELVKNYTPKNQYKLAITHKLPEFDGLTVGLNYRWQDDTKRIQPTTSLGVTPVTKQDAFGILNLMATYDITDNIGVSFNLNNVTNEKYLHSLYWEQGYYGAPRSYGISMNWQL